MLTQNERDQKKQRTTDLLTQFTSMTEEAKKDYQRNHGVLLLDGNPLSPRNTFLAIGQMPTATIVGGFRQFLAQGRSVRKGQHGFSLLVPIFHRQETEGDNPEQLKGFMSKPFFDISQTCKIGEEPAGTVEAPKPAPKPQEADNLFNHISKPQLIATL